MRWRLAQIAFLVAALVLTSQQQGHAQNDVVQVSASCPSLRDTRNDPPEISISDVNFWGSLQMPISDQEQIVDSVKKTYGTSLERVADEGLDRVRAGWQDRGYYKVLVTGETRIFTNNPARQSIGLSVHVDEGSRYNLSGITFTNNKVISNVDILRGFFPIADGDIFSREKIGTGLENLRKAYGEVGYINFMSVPNTKFDDENRLISLEIDFDEGKQFRVGGINVLGLKEPAREELLKAFPIKRPNL